MDCSRHHRFLIFFSALLIVPLIIVGALKLLIAKNAIRTEQFKPPAGMLSIKPAMTVAKTPLPASYEKYLAAQPGKSSLFYLKYFSKSHNLRADFVRYVSAQWLTDHRDFVDELIEAAEAGDFPMISHDEAAACYQSGHFALPHPDPGCLRMCVRTLIAESRRRREAKDFEGAAKALVAAHALARTMHGPTLDEMVFAASVQTEAGRELARWLRDGTMEADFARKMREPIAESIITLDQYRRAVELEYIRMRVEQIRYYSQSFSEIYYDKMKSRIIEKGVQDPDVIRAAGSYAKGMATSSYGAVRDKTYAAKEIAKFDEEFRRVFECIVKDQPSVIGKYRKYRYHVDTSWENQARARIRVNMALMQLNLAGLDLITSTTTNTIDPFGHAPLRKFEDTSGTLIYSIGPDMVDQRGAVGYDPWFSRDSKGDIAVRIPLRMVKR